MLLTAEHIAKNYGDRQLLKDVTMYLNAGDKPATVLSDDVLYSRHMDGSFLLPGGVAVVRQEVREWKSCL